MNDRVGRESSDTQALQVLRQFRLIFGSVKQHFREIEETCGISGSHLWVLREVGRHPGIGITDLSRLLSVHQSTCSLLVEKLDKKGLIAKRRSQSDQRRVGLHLLPEGKRILAAAPGPSEGILPEALQALPEAALVNLSAGLTEVISNLRSRDERSADRPLADI